MASPGTRHASRKRPTSRPAVPRALWVMLALVIVLFVALLAWLGMQEPQPQGPKGEASAPAKPAAPPAPRYEFYDMLPEQKVEVPPAAPVPPPAAPSAAPPAAPPAPAEGAVRYELQVGSFRRYEEADRRKAELALLGYASSIESANVRGETWHRVKVGPLTEAEARALRERLQAMGMNPLLIKQGG